MSNVLYVLALYAIFHVLRARYQQQHIVLLGTHLAPLDIEKNMQTLVDGYMRALDEPDSARRQMIWSLFEPTERVLAAQFRRLSDGVGKEAAEYTRISKLPVAVPWLENIVPSASRDFRALLKIHSDGIAQTVENTAQLGAKDRAYQLSAEIFLAQHSCHWFCKSRMLANARLFAHHKVNHQKVLASVSQQTRQAYMQWLQT